MRYPSATSIRNHIEQLFQLCFRLRDVLAHARLPAFRFSRPFALRQSLDFDDVVVDSFGAFEALLKQVFERSVGPVAHFSEELETGCHRIGHRTPLLDRLARAASIVDVDLVAAVRAFVGLADLRESPLLLPRIRSSIAFGTADVLAGVAGFGHLSFPHCRRIAVAPQSAVPVRRQYGSRLPRRVRASAPRRSWFLRAPHPSNRRRSSLQSVASPRR